MTAVIRASNESSFPWSQTYNSVYVISNPSEEDILADRLRTARYYLGGGIVLFGLGLLALYKPLQVYLQ